MIDNNNNQLNNSINNFINLHTFNIRTLNYFNKLYNLIYNNNTNYIKIIK